MNEYDRCWLIGLLEAEGSFVLNRQTWRDREYLYARIRIGMTDKDVVQRVCDLWGTNMSVVVDDRQSHYKDVFATTLSHSASVGLMEDILESMSPRRQEQIRGVLNHPDLRPVEGR